MKKHMIFYGVFILIILLLSITVCKLAIDESNHIKMNFNMESGGVVPENGYVPDEETAIAIAEAVWLPIYGGDIYTKKPYLTEYDNSEDCWRVIGQLPPDTFGGVPMIKIRKTTGEILYVGHEK